MINQRQLFLNHVAQTSDAPLMLEIESAKGVHLFDTQGKSYIDLISGISVSNVGHCHPKVVKAIQKQAETYMHLMVYGEYVQTPQVQLAAFLSSKLPNHLNAVYFTNSGTEAAEGAMKLAKRATGRTEIVYFKGGYHGSSMGSLSVMGDEYYRQNYRPLVPGNRMLHYGNMEDLEQISNDTAAVIIETIQAESGITAPEKTYLQKLRKRCDEHGALLILDEIQCGVGRTGKFYAFEHFGITPDILLTAKGLGGGMPIGAFIASRELMAHFQDNPVLGHITTFGGHPVCCAASLACVQAIFEENLMDGVAEKNQLFHDLLQHPKIEAKRSFGLMMCLQFDSFETNKAIIDKCIENGLITDWFLYNPAALRIAPPLIIQEKEIRESCEILQEAIDAVLS